MARRSDDVREELTLSSALSRILREWQESFEDHFDPEGGWASDVNRGRFQELCAMARERLGAEAGHQFEAIYHDWPR